MEDATNVMVTPYDSSKPITKLFVHIYKGVQIIDKTGVCRTFRVVETTALSASLPAPTSELKHSSANKSSILIMRL